jgi:tRNA A37 threonylcarbamoyladenosine dehydratase
MAANPLFQRLTLITGPEAAAALERSRVIVVGLGGVGGWAAEALARSGVGHISLVDSDTVAVSNINRQVQATGSTLGRLKTEALEERLKDINPSCEIKSFPLAFSKSSAAHFDIPGTDYVIDAIDTLGCKLDLIEAALAAGKWFFSSMGMAQKLDPALIRTADIWETSGCSLARLVRQGMRKRNIRGHFTAVYSPERLPRREFASLGTACEQAQYSGRDPAQSGEPGPQGMWDSGKKVINGSAVTVTAAAGMVLASLVIRDVCGAFTGGASE